MSALIWFHKLYYLLSTFNYNLSTGVPLRSNKSHFINRIFGLHVAFFRIPLKKKFLIQVFQLCQTVNIYVEVNVVLILCSCVNVEVCDCRRQICQQDCNQSCFLQYLCVSHARFYSFIFKLTFLYPIYSQICVCDIMLNLVACKYSN